MSELLRSVGHDPLLMAGVRLLTPPLREVYSVLVQAGIVNVTIDSSSAAAPAPPMRRLAASGVRNSSSGADADTQSCNCGGQECLNPTQRARM